MYGAETEEVDLSQMTSAELARVTAVIEADPPVRMLDLHREPVTVVGREMVRARLAVGYQLVEEG